MTDEEDKDELAAEAIEDLEAPAWTQDPVGGANTAEHRHASEGRRSRRTVRARPAPSP